jgi:hypothetical protein
VDDESFSPPTLYPASEVISKSPKKLIKKSLCAIICIGLNKCSEKILKAPKLLVESCARRCKKSIAVDFRSEG